MANRFNAAVNYNDDLTYEPKKDRKAEKVKKVAPKKVTAKIKPETFIKKKGGVCFSLCHFLMTKSYKNDILLKNFDVSIGGRKLLIDANLTLAYGRKFGLVGRNGFGKTYVISIFCHAVQHY